MEKAGKTPGSKSYYITRRFQRMFEYARRFDHEHAEKQPIFLRRFPEPWQDRQIPNARGEHAEVSLDNDRRITA